MNPFKIQIALISTSKLILFAAVCSLLLFACKDKPVVDLTKKEIVESPAEINTRAEDIIKGTLQNILAGDKEIADSFRFHNAAIMDGLYEKQHYQPIWSANGAFTAPADSLIAFIDSARIYGLFLLI